MIKTIYLYWCQMSPTFLESHNRNVVQAEKIVYVVKYSCVQTKVALMDVKLPASCIYNSYPGTLKLPNELILIYMDRLFRRRSYWTLTMWAEIKSDRFFIHSSITNQENQGKEKPWIKRLVMVRKPLKTRNLINVK